MSIHVNDIAAELDVPVERVIRTLELCGIGHAHNLNTGDRLLTKTAAERVLAIYRNCAGYDLSTPRPTPENLREEYTRDEQNMIISTYGHNTELW